ncbi:MAG: PspC domain-containing protein [Acidimicrobiales bacterium]|nr:PspC domain-containing protein [Acidimicrobiales bacterium]
MRAAHIDDDAAPAGGQPAAEPEPPIWQVPRLKREGRVVGGVAAAIAAEVGVDPLVVRIAFVVLAVAGGWGVALYAACWGVLSLLADRDEAPYRPVPKGPSEVARLAGFGLVVFGLLLSFRELGGFVGDLVWPLAVLGSGLAVAHQRGASFGGRSLAGAAGPDDDRGGFLVRVAAGLVLVVAGVVLAITLNFDLSVVRDTVLASAVVLAGVTLVLGPWILGTARDLGEERRRRIRSEERSEMAAHLHDSVLQTLALIQRRSADSEVVMLARRQERELRTWLFGDRSPVPPGPGGERAGFRDRLAAELAGVEGRHRVAVELVVVGGDAVVDQRVEAILAAAREAATNAARHAGVARVDVFAEVSAATIDVFIRDTGRGFDPAEVGSDRRGISDSIVARMGRAGGSAEVSSSIGTGTEVELHLPREPR